MKDLEIYAWGLCHMSVCSKLTCEETVAGANQVHPTGISHPWQLADEPFKTGEPNPCPCNFYPETHKHYLLVC